MPPALTLLLTRTPAAVWLWLNASPPALTLDFTRRPLAVWLWLLPIPPAFTLDLTLISVSPSSEFVPGGSHPPSPLHAGIGGGLPHGKTNFFERFRAGGDSI